MEAMPQRRHPLRSTQRLLALRRSEPAEHIRTPTSEVQPRMVADVHTREPKNDVPLSTSAPVAAGKSYLQVPSILPASHVDLSKF